MNIKITSFCYLLIIFGNTAVAQTTASTQTINKLAPTVTTTEPLSLIAQLPYVIQAGARSIEETRARKRANAGDFIFVQIDNPKAFLDERPADDTKLILYANDVELKGVTSDLFKKISKDSYKSTDTLAWVSFELKRDSTTKAAWDYLYKLTDNWHQDSLLVNLSIGWEHMLPVHARTKSKNDASITIILFDEFQIFTMSILYVTLIVILFLVIAFTDILKDSDGVYSLAQTQLAFWTILIIGGFLYSLVLTGIASTLNSSVLVLLGISLTTNGSAAWIDYYKKSKVTEDAITKKTQGFFSDIFGYENSISMLRFQQVFWTVVLGVYYTTFTIKNKIMPVIPDVLLYLTGISSLSYVAAKPTESISTTK